jgi:hypothetical protein
MVPQMEAWTIEAAVCAPYIIGDIKEAVMFRAQNAVDALVLVPLEREEPLSDNAQIVDFGDVDIALDLQEP